MAWVLLAYSFLVGAIIGSFLNVVIHRVPREESIVFPASHCPNCGHKIRAWDNIPIVSYLVLRGRCRDCHDPISIRYPLIELANGLMYLAIFRECGVTLALPILCAMASMWIALIYIDLDHQILPDVIDLPGVALGVLAGFATIGRFAPDFVLSSGWLDSLIGAAAGYLLLWSVAKLYWLLRRVEGMGEGDMKMLAMIGAILGWRAIGPVILVASLTGSIFGVALAIRRKADLQIALPFGVFLGLAAFTVMLFGHTLGEWYRAMIIP